MRAIYEIRGNGWIVDTITFDVTSDPDSYDNCTVATYSAGYDPEEGVAESGYPTYRAVFTGYEGGVVDVPVVVIEALEQLMSNVPYQTLKQTGAGRTLFLQLRRVSNMLFESGCIDTTLRTD